MLALFVLLELVIAQGDGDRSLRCEGVESDALRQRLGASGRLSVETSTAGAEVKAWQHDVVVWSGHVRSQDCAVINQVVELSLARAQRRRSATLPVGEVPSLVDPPSVVDARADVDGSAGADPTSVVAPTAGADPTSVVAPSPVVAPTASVASDAEGSDWHLEIGAGPLLELEGPRVGGSLDVALRRRGIGGLIELGAYGSRDGVIEGANSEIGALSFFTAHALLSVDGCLENDWMPDALRPCVGLGGGLEWLDARAEGERLFRSVPQGRVLNRLDATVRVGGSSGRAGVDGSVRLTWRPGRPLFGVEGAAVDVELPEWTLGLGLRGWVHFF